MTLRVRDLALEGVKLITPRRHADDRGWFAETYSRAALAAAEVAFEAVQENQSLSRAAGTVRGLHFQAPPAAQAKLVRVTRGRIRDVAVDIRHRSPTFGQWVAADLDAATGDQLLIPRGFAHGFCTLEQDTEVVYLVDAPYSATHDRFVHWADPAIGVDWPVEAERAVLSDKDRTAPRLADIDTGFRT